VPPYALLQQGIAISPDGNAVLMSRDLFRLLTGTLAQAAGFDPQWYGTEYPDVAEAIRNGELGSAAEHFTYCGYEEGRIPAPLAVDEDFYRGLYPDVEDALAGGAFAGADEHYRAIGYREGYVPTPEAEGDALRWQHVITESGELVQSLGAEAEAAGLLEDADT
jgi:hypothetical protein